MAYADISRSVLRYVKESVWGTTPTSALKTLRITSCTLDDTETRIASAEIVSDRQVTDVVRTDVGSAGDIAFEASYGNIDDLLEGVAMAAWSADDPSSGQDTLENGTTLTSFTFEKEFNDITQFQTFKGCRISTWSLTLAPGQMVTGTLGVLGKPSTWGTSTAGTGTASAAPTNGILNCISHITSVSEGGSPLTSKISNLTFNYNNNLRAQNAIGTLGPIGIGYGTIGLEGSVTLFFENTTLITKYKNDTRSSLAFVVTDGAGNKYTITFPKIAYTKAAVPLSGINQDGFVQLGFSAYKDSVSGKTFSIVREAA